MLQCFAHGFLPEPYGGVLCAASLPCSCLTLLPFFSSHHGMCLSSSSIRTSSHVFRFLDASGGHNHSETCVGCMVSSTTATNCSLNCSKSTSVRNVALKAARVLAALYFRR